MTDRIRKWSPVDWGAHLTLVLVLATLCGFALDQHWRVRELGTRLETVEARVTTANQRAWAPWSQDVTERLERVEALLRRYHPPEADS